MEAGAQSFHLPESRLGASSWHSQLIKSSFWVFLGAFFVFFCNFLVLTRLPGPANGSFGSQLWFAGVSAQEDALAPSFLVIFLSILGHFSLFSGLAGRLGSGCNWVEEKLLHMVFIRLSFSLIRAAKLKNETEKGEQKRAEMCRKKWAAWDCPGRLGLFGHAFACLGCCFGSSGVVLRCLRSALAALDCSAGKLGLFQVACGCLECLGSASSLCVPGLAVVSGGLGALI